jgi:3-oxoacyl-[acyl-carrier-protein] synthase II
MLTPIGNTATESWTNALAGVSGAGPILTFDTTDHAVKFSSSGKDRSDAVHGSKGSAPGRPFIQYGMAAAVQAIADAGIEPNPPDSDRYGVAIGSGIGGILTINTRTRCCSKAGRGACRRSSYPPASST